MDDALRSFEGVLAGKPTNLVALLGKVLFRPVIAPLPILIVHKARILYARRQFPQALKLFQQVLQYNPQCIPDPRIGIGLCLWAMDHKAKAKAAWQRSLEVVRPGFLASENPLHNAIFVFICLEPLRMARTAATWVGGYQHEQKRQFTRRGNGTFVPYGHEIDREGIQC